LLVRELLSANGGDNLGQNAVIDHHGFANQLCFGRLDVTVDEGGNFLDWNHARIRHRDAARRLGSDLRRDFSDDLTERTYLPGTHETFVEMAMNTL
jgi:hypothetical protein